MASLAIRVTPRASKPGIGEWKADPGGRAFLEVRVAAAPTDGNANAEVIKLLSKALGVPKGAISIASGHSSRLKRLDVELDEALLAARLNAPS